MASQFVLASSKSDLEQLLEDKNYTEFFLKVRQGVKQGDADAQFFLGKAFHLGLGTPRDLYTAKKYYEMARVQKHARAIHNLGLLTEELYGDYPQAIEYYNEALALGLKMPTLINLARIHDDLCTNMSEVKFCDEAGETNLKLYAERNSPVTFEGAVTSFSRACEISTMLKDRFKDREQSEVEKNACAKAIPIVDQGVAMGMLEALYQRASIEFHEKRYSESIKLYEKAALQGHAKAAYDLGVQYDIGYGVERNEANEAIARQWFERSKRGNYRPAITMLKVMDVRAQLRQK